MKAWYVVGAVGAGLVLVLLNRQRVVSNLKNTQLGPNFTLDEFVVTSTGLDNVPGPRETANLRELVTYFLQPLRDRFTRKYPGRKVAVHINSAYRSPLVNAAVGGAKTSQHKSGEAADFYVTIDGTKLSNAEVIAEARQIGIPYDQIIDEQVGGKVWVHGSYDSDNGRRQWLTARDGSSGQTVYETVQYG